jgi:hypothetical protein
MRKRTGLFAILAIAILFSYADPTWSQTSVASLNGTVLDESGGTVSGATISLREMDRNTMYSATSDQSGYYAIPNLPPGRYELKAEFKGFSKYTQTGTILSVGQTATVNITLKVEAHGEEVIVSTEAPTIEPTKTEISQVIDTKQINDLPISGRLFTDFALLTAGVATGRTSLQSTITEFESTRVRTTSTP